MNNNQDNLNINQQNPSINQNSNPISTNNQFGFNQQPVNYIPQSPQINPSMNTQPQTTMFNENQNITNNIQVDTNDFNMPQQYTSIQNNNMNQQFFEPKTFSSNLNQPIQGGFSEIDEELKIQSTNRFINDNIDSNNSLNQLNIEDEYNNIPRDYTNDPKVQKNLIQEEKKKNTITITGEAKVFLLIIGALLLFVFILPYIFDLIRDIQY